MKDKLEEFYKKLKTYKNKYEWKLNKAPIINGDFIYKIRGEDINSKNICPLEAVFGNYNAAESWSYRDEVMAAADHFKSWPKYSPEIRTKLLKILELKEGK